MYTGLKFCKFNKMKPLLQICRVKKAGIYLRISTKKQKEGAGLKEQLEICQNYCELKNLNVFRIYSDQISGTTEWHRREEMTIMMNDIKQKKFDCLVVYAFDRISREMFVTLEIIKIIQEFSVDVIVCKQEIDTSTEVGRIKMAFYTAITQADLKTIKDRLRMGREVKAANHGDIGGRLPFGYVRKEKEIEIDPYKAELVKFIFNSHQKEKCSMNLLAKILTEAKIETSKKKGNIWYASSIQAILDNESKYRGGLIGKNTNDVRWPKILD